MAGYYGSNGVNYVLDNQPLASGGEGAIFKVQSSPGLVAKIYHSATPTIERKISVMVSHPPAPKVAAQMAWPIDIVRDSSGQFKGFIMRKLDTTHELLSLYKYPPMEYAGITLRHKFIIAQNICTVISGVHKAGYVFGDFNPMNIGVNLRTGTIAFFDTDSYHICDPSTHQTYRCSVCLSGYVAPELIAACKSYQKTNPQVKDVYATMPLPTFTNETDNFALAIHIFKLLMNGFTPFNGITASTAISQAAPGLGDAAVERDNYCFKPGFRPMSVATPPLDSLPKYIQDLFQQAFIQGRNQPSKRPTADEWYLALERYEKELVTCSSNQNHLYYKGLSNCPWCEADARYAREISPAAITPAPQIQPIIPPNSTISNYTPPSQNSSNITSPVQPQTVWQKASTFWAITLIASAILSAVFVVLGGYSPYGGSSFGNELANGIADFLDVLAPFILFGGGIAGTIFYNVKFAVKNTNRYTTKNYVLAILMSPAGVIVTTIACVLLVFAIYILIVILVFGIIIGALSGS